MALQSSMQSSRLYLLSIVVLAVLWKLQAWAAVHRRRLRFKREHGCQEPRKFPNKDPIFGLDLVWSTYQSFKNNNMLPEWVSRYKAVGNTYSVILAGHHRISTIEPENMKAMLSTSFTSYILPPRRTEVLTPFLGQSIFTSNGAQWQHSRAIIRPHLAKDSFVDGEMSRFEKHVRRFLSTLPRDGSKVDLQPLFFRFTMAAALDMLTGYDVGSSQNPLSTAVDIGQIFDDAQRLMAYRIVIPFSRMGAEEKRYIEVCHDWVDRLVLQALEEHRSSKSIEGSDKDEDGEAPSFLQALVKETDDAIRIRSELLAVLIAARDTTAATLSSLWFILAKRPDVVAKLRVEVAKLGGERPGFSRLKSMHYLQHTIQELLRLYPPVPAATFVAIEDTMLPVGGGADEKHPIFIPKGQAIGNSIFAMHRRKDIYGEDAEEFRPERWEDKTLRPGWGYLPFNGGPRACLGQQFALTELAYTTVRLLEEFETLESRDDSPWQENWMTSVSVKTGCQVSLIPNGGIVSD